MTESKTDPTPSSDLLPAADDHQASEPAIVSATASEATGLPIAAPEAPAQAMSAIAQAIAEELAEPVMQHDTGSLAAGPAGDPTATLDEVATESASSFAADKLSDAPSSAPAGDSESGSDPWSLVGTVVDGLWLVDSWAGASDFCSTYRVSARDPAATADVTAAGDSCIRVFSAFADTPPDRRAALLASFADVENRLRRLSETSKFAPGVRGHGSLEIDGRWLPYLALEWVEGKTLLDVLLEETQRGRPARDLATAVRTLSGPAAALETAHDLGILHLDLKPENILVTRSATGSVRAVKLLDFGVTRLVTGIGEGEDARDRPTHCTITPEYAAPEQYDASYGKIGPQTDVFAFALVLLEVMRGGRSVLGEGLEFDAHGIAEMRRRATNRLRRPTPSRIGLAVDPAVDAVFARALAVDPRKRQANMGAFRQLLLDAIDRSGLAGETLRSPSAGVPSPPTFAGDDPTTPTPSPTLPGLAAFTVAEASELRAAEGPAAPAGVADLAVPEPIDAEDELDGFEPSPRLPVKAARSRRPRAVNSPPISTSGEIVAESRAISSVRIDPDYAELLANQQAEDGSERLYGERSSLAKLVGFARSQPAATGAVVLASMLIGLGINWLFATDSVAGAASEQMQIQADAAPGTPSPDAVQPGMAAEPPAPVGPSCPENMALVDGGKYFMGSDSEHFALRSAQPAHQVSIESFCIDLNEVTVADFRHCSKVGECKRAHRDSLWPRGRTDEDSWRQQREINSQLCNERAKTGERTKHPINCVTWEQAYSYCHFVGKRLPLESEWEFAARGSDGRIFPWGDAKPDATRMNACGAECLRWRETNGLDAGRAMYETDDGFPGTAPVGQFPAGRTQHGLADMVGNVFEWTQDVYRPYGEQAEEPKTARARNRRSKAPELGEDYVIRGGAMNSFVPEFSDPALRYGMAMDAHTHAIGFRCASDPLPGSGPADEQQAPESTESTESGG